MNTETKKGKKEMKLNEKIDFQTASKVYWNNRQNLLKFDTFDKFGTIHHRNGTLDSLDKLARLQEQGAVKIKLYK